MDDRWKLAAASALLAASLNACPSAFSQTVDPPLGATIDGLLVAGRSLSPALRAAALDTEAAAAKAEGAGALDDPAVSDSYQYYRDPGVYSAHALMLSQSFPLWGKRSLREQAALADVEAARGRARAAQDALDEAIKGAYARYYLITQAAIVNREVGSLARLMQAATAARYGAGGGDQLGVIQAMGEQTAARTEAVRLDGERAAAQARLNTLIGRPGDAMLAEPLRETPLPSSLPALGTLLDRARAANPTLSADDAAVTAARTRRTLADKAWYPDITVGAGPLIQTNNRQAGFAATIGFNIPVPWGREVSGQREAQAELGATQARYDSARLEIEGALGEALAKLQAAMATERLLRQESMPQARGAYKSVLASYAQGRGELITAITAEHQMHDVELRMLRAQYEQQMQLAAIERLIGGGL